MNSNINNLQDADDVGCNPSSNPSLMDLVNVTMSRRRLLKGGAAALGASVLGGGALMPSRAMAATPALGFSAVAKSRADAVIVPEGYSVNVLYALGDRLVSSIPEFSNDGTQGDFDLRSGDHHDGMYFFGMDAAGNYDPAASDRGLLVMNHENISQQYLHVNGGPTLNEDGSRASKDEVIREMECHGVSVIEVAKDVNGQFQRVEDSAYNRRITPFTKMNLRGPLRGSRFAITPYSLDGSNTRGTLNNCANGYTPWGTYLTCEENWAFYFRRAAGDDALRSAAENLSLSRYGIVPGATGSYRWADINKDRFKRLDISVTGADATQDYRNEAYTFGWIVEIDPFDADSLPAKRTAMGRFFHENCELVPPVAGKPLVFYSGCDARGEYLYKFVSREVWDPADVGGGVKVGNKYLDHGKLFVAKFNADGSGSWVRLAYGKNRLDETNPLYPFADDVDVLVNARLAADAVGATKMDRPEWAAVNPVTGEAYLTLTNNSNRRVVVTSSSQQAVDAANPRSYDSDNNGTENGNVNGHIIRWAPVGGDHAEQTFTWDIYLFGSRASYDAATVNLSELSDDNDFSSPDGLWMDGRGLAWIQTDDGAYQDTTNCMMLVGRPGVVGDGASLAVNGVTTYVGEKPGNSLLRRFLVGPVGCEITGITMTPDYRTLFVNIQHPGENGSVSAPNGTWPAADGVSRPRSATIVISRDDGGELAI